MGKDRFGGLCRFPRLLADEPDGERGERAGRLEPVGAPGLQSAGAAEISGVVDGQGFERRLDSQIAGQADGAAALIKVSRGLDDNLGMSSLSDSAILEQYKLARDALVAAINSGSMLVEYQIMSQRKRVTDPIKELEFVETQIRAYEQRADQAAHGRIRNFAEIHRR